MILPSHKDFLFSYNSEFASLSFNIYISLLNQLLFTSSNFYLHFRQFLLTPFFKVYFFLTYPKEIYGHNTLYQESFISLPEAFLSIETAWWILLFPLEIHSITKTTIVWALKYLLGTLHTLPCLGLKTVQ